MNYYFDAFDRAMVILDGADSQDLLHRLSTNDLSKLSESDVVNTILTNEKGRIIDVISVLKIKPMTLLLIGQSNDNSTLTPWLEKYIVMEDVKIKTTNLTGHYIAFDVDKKNELVKKILEQPEKFTTDIEFVPKDSETIIFSDSWSKTPLIHVLFQDSVKHLMDGNLQNAGFTRTPLDKFDSFRVRNLIPKWPNELSNHFNPLEANLIELISFSKGCYIGQEVIARLDTYKKVQRRLVKLELGDQPGSLPAAIHDSKEEVGTITSVSPAIIDDHFEGLGYLAVGAMLNSHDKLYFKRDDKKLIVKPLINVEEFN